MADTSTQVDRAYDHVVDWLEHFEPLEDARHSGKVAYPVSEMLLQCLLAVLAGADSWVEVALFGKRKLDFLHRFAAFEAGTPSHDQFDNLFSARDAEGFQKCFIAWVSALAKLGPDIVAIDGETLRRSYQEGGVKAPVHMISAFSSSQRLVLGQRKVADRSNEITAIPELLDLLTIKGAIPDRRPGRPSTRPCETRLRHDGLSARDRPKNRGEGRRSCARPEGQSGHTERRCRVVLC